MKKLLSTVALAALVSMPALAQEADGGLQLNVGGHFKGYAVAHDQDEPNNAEVRSLDILRETELHFTGETTLDNGLTVGAHIELDIDGGEAENVDESYAYFSGLWGRVNFGNEDGVAYLMQVSAPSADDNIDGLRQYVSAVNYAVVDNTNLVNLNNGLALGTVVRDLGVAGASTSDINLASAVGGTNSVLSAGTLFSFDYENTIANASDRLSYLTPVFGGFQVGLSYAPEVNNVTRTNGVGTDEVAGNYGDLYELAARYEGDFGGWGLVAGAGYAHASVERESTIAFIQGTTVGSASVADATDTILSRTDDRQAYNGGLSVNVGPVNVGASYTSDDLGVDGADADRDTWVFGADYTYGAFKFGASYYMQDQELEAVYGAGVGELETDRYSGGVVYTYGPGMTFRGSVSYIEHELPTVLSTGAGNSDVEATTLYLGTQINF